MGVLQNEDGSQKGDEGHRLFKLTMYIAIMVKSLYCKPENITTFLY